MKSLILYSTIVGSFYAQTPGLEAAISESRAQVGNDVWKRGFSGSDPLGATAVAVGCLKAAGITPIVFEGHISHIGFVENSDQVGNRYPKLRVGLESLDDQYLLSIDLKSDVAQRLLVKLDNCAPGQYIKVSAWPTVVEKGGRKFINHAASVKDSNGTEVPANTAFSAEVKTKTESIESALKAAGVADTKVIATAKANRRVEAHKELLIALSKRFTEAKQAA